MVSVRLTQPSPIAWKEIKQTGSVPPPIAGHTIVTLGKFHYMFGGLEKPESLTDPSKLLPQNNLYAIRIVNNTTVEWTLKPCTGDVPMPRAYHSACKVGEDKIFIFGGCYTSNLRYNDTFFLKLRNIPLTQPTLSGANLPTKNQQESPKMPCPKSEDLSPGLTIP